MKRISLIAALLIGSAIPVHADTDIWNNVQKQQRATMRCMSTAPSAMPNLARRRTARRHRHATSVACSRAAGASAARVARRTIAIPILTIPA